jgi:F420-dependent oxidoreductase-like protein
MKLGMGLPAMTWEGEPAHLAGKLAEIVGAAEEAGFDLITIPDHVWLHPIMGGPEQNHLEAYTTLGYLAAHTRKARLLTLATAAPYRPPGLLAKIVTTLDVLSGGRAMLGIGCGDYAEEAAGLGLPFPEKLRDRFDLLDETVQVCLRMWEGELGSQEPFHGEHVRLERALNVPQSLQRPHPPILIAGGGEKRTLPLVARYADACNLPPTPEIPRLLDLLKRLFEQEGRDFDALEKTAPYLFDVGENGEKVPELLEQLRWLSDLGIQTVFGWVVGVERIEPLEIMAREVFPVIREWP